MDSLSGCSCTGKKPCWFRGQERSTQNSIMFHARVTFNHANNFSATGMLEHALPAAQERHLASLYDTRAADASQGARTIVEAAQAKLAADDKQALPQREALQHHPEAHLRTQGL